MAQQTLHAVFTMDCEQLAVHSQDGGPADWNLSERAIVGFAEELRAQGFRATYFLVPQAAERHARLLLDLQGEGFELGLHLHSPDQGWRDHLGGLTPEEQYGALAEASDRWAQVLGQAPRAFRSGNFSANDHTFPLLARLGYTHTSTSSPRRRLLARHAVWSEALPYAHWTHAGNRLLAGDLPVVEVPLCVHPTAARDAAQTIPWEARIEGGEWEHHGEIIAANLDWQEELAAPLRTCVVFTHNTREYSNPQDEMTRRLRRIMALLEEEAARRNWQLAKTTVGGVRSALEGSRPVQGRQKGVTHVHWHPQGD
ncbi:MAG TPA: hypothetical protein EYP85_11130 [Armatimonadetes bacterium]|nr:hypothetical protein [Armatimonadota bacterium]